MTTTQPRRRNHDGATTTAQPRPKVFNEIDAIEGQYSIIGVCVAAGVMGPAFFQDTTILGVPLNMIILVALMLKILENLYSYLMKIHSKSETKDKLLAQLTPVAVHSLLSFACFWKAKQAATGDAAAQSAAIVQALTISMLSFGDVTNRMLLYQISGTPMLLFPRFALNFLLFAVGGEAVGVTGWTHAALAVALYVGLCTSTISDICTCLGIRAFVVPKEKQLAAQEAKKAAQ